MSAPATPFRLLRPPLAAAVAFALLITTACGSDSQRTTDRFCSDLRVFGESILAFGDLNTDSSRDDVQRLREEAGAAFDDLRESAADYRDLKSDGLQASWDELQAAIDAADSSASIAEAVEPITDAALNVGKELAQALFASDCWDY